MYNILHEINMAARNVRKLVYSKREKNVKETGILDPDMFPINRLSEDLVVEYESVWETNKGNWMLGQIENYVGHSLRVKDSNIDHHLAGNGVFISCKK